MMNFCPLLFALVLLFSASSLYAQDPPPVRILKTRSISFQIDEPVQQVFAHSLTALPEAIGVPVKVKSYLNHQVESLPISGNQLIFTTSPNRSSIQSPEQIVAKTQVPKTLRSAVLMFLPGSGEKDAPKYRILPIEDTIRSFPPGSFKVINLSPRPLRITLEKSLYDIKAGATRVIEDPPVNKRNSCAMRAYNYADEQWQIIGSTSWLHPGKKRVIHIAFINPKSKKVEFRGIRDISVRKSGQ